MRLACRELSSWLARGATVVTPTPFLAAVAHEQITRERLKQGLETWERPPIYGLEAWLSNGWQEARYLNADFPSLLSPAQESALWHSVIEQEHPQLFDISATARLARDAASLIAQWHIPAEGESWNDQPDAQQFQHWSRFLRRQCQTNHWITRADLYRWIPIWIAEGQLAAKLTVFIGFEHISPALENIHNALGRMSAFVPFDQKTPLRKAVAEKKEEFPAEVEFAARRLRRLFEEDPKRSLALFVPDLATHSELVARTLRAVFFPSAEAKVAGPRTAAPESLFRISAAKRLIDHPIVSSALLLLNLASPRIDHADAGAILRSTFIGGASEEKHQRALADIDLRKRRELDFVFQDLERVSRNCPILAGNFKRVSKLLPRSTEVRHLSQWSEFISDLLLALGWPGKEALDDREDRIIDLWKDQLSTLSGLGLVTPRVTLAAALEYLNRLLAFPLERGEWSSPIQVLDASQANGVDFDSAIVVGLSEDNWPPPIRVSPLIPFKLQRSKGVPGSNPQSVTEERVRITKALFVSAAEVLVTYHERMPSLVDSFVAKKGRELPVWQGSLARESFPPMALEQLADGQAPPFIAKGDVAGGTGIIKAQSQCPFQAFAKYRLHARRPEDASFGFDALDRGTFVHRALEKVWERLKSQAELKRTPAEDLRTLVRETIAGAVETKESGLLHQLSVETERERLEELILEWLDIERLREQAFTVETVEQERKFEVPGLSLKLRIDRIDRLSNGNLILIDYKSGKQTHPKLSGERPAEPQLLVYAASVGSGVDGVFFGQLRPREVRPVGYSRTKQFQGKAVLVKKDWDSYIEESRENIEKLADEFVRGVAEVRPTGAPCEYCGMKPFCRVNERGASEDEEE